jgi:hypothetical protein
VLCTAGATCLTTDGAKTGTCVAPAKAGGSCDSARGRGCVLPYSCIRGRCRLSEEGESCG